MFPQTVLTQLLTLRASGCTWHCPLTDEPCFVTLQSKNNNSQFHTQLDNDAL